MSIMVNEEQDTQTTVNKPHPFRPSSWDSLVCGANINADNDPNVIVPCCRVPSDQVHEAKNPSGVKSESLVSQVEGLATPRPWKVFNVGVALDTDMVDIVAPWSMNVKPSESSTFGDHRGALIATLPYVNTKGAVPTKEQAVANAALIVRAVNRDAAFDALVEALRNIRGVGHVAAPFDRSAYAAALQRANDKLDQAMEWAETALKLAEGKQS